MESFLIPASRYRFESFIRQEIANYSQRTLIAVDDQYPLLPLSLHDLPVFSDLPIERGTSPVENHLLLSTGEMEQKR